MSAARERVSERNPKAVNSVLEQIGNTPLLRFVNITKEFDRVDIYGKAEWFNPGGSVKDRPALRMIEEGERSGALTRDKVILDSSSGNTGIAYALIGAVKGYRVELAVPRNVSRERKRILQAYGAHVVYTDPLAGSDGAIREAHRRYQADPEKYFMPDQYNNAANWHAHYDTTGPEIIEQTKGRITHFVAGVGTGGTLMGTGRRLREFNSRIRIAAVLPAEDLHGIEGLKHMETAIVPGIWDDQFPDLKLTVRTEDAYGMARRLALEEGVLVGQSGGAAVYAALDLARQLSEGVIVTVLPDAGDRYFSTGLWEG
ncbi:MAG: cysteine synthase family protein [Planctomycetaceae bacterium]|jgi:S-sulfo-L-cysteine synthase (O-acetyl-L-serine-dependent)|nr:MAG: cysteine synthase family protein [Planctomycetaceae bacterium]